MNGNDGRRSALRRYMKRLSVTLAYWSLPDAGKAAEKVSELLKNESAPEKFRFKERPLGEDEAERIGFGEFADDLCISRREAERERFYVFDAETESGAEIKVYLGRYALCASVRTESWTADDAHKAAELCGSLAGLPDRLKSTSLCARAFRTEWFGNGLEKAADPKEFPKTDSARGRYEDVYENAEQTSRATVFRTSAAGIPSMSVSIAERGDEEIPETSAEWTAWTERSLEAAELLAAKCLKPDAEPAQLSAEQLWSAAETLMREKILPKYPRFNGPIPILPLCEYPEKHDRNLLYSPNEFVSDTPYSYMLCALNWKSPRSAGFQPIGLDQNGLPGDASGIASAVLKMTEILKSGGADPEILLRNAKTEKQRKQTFRIVAYEYPNAIIAFDLDRKNDWRPALSDGGFVLKNLGG